MKNLWLVLLLLNSTLSIQAQGSFIQLVAGEAYTNGVPHHRSSQTRSGKRCRIKQRAFVKYQRSLKRMAMADGKITRNERKLLRKSASRHKRVQKGHAQRPGQRENN